MKIVYQIGDAPLVRINELRRPEPAKTEQRPKSVPAPVVTYLTIMGPDNVEMRIANQPEIQMPEFETVETAPAETVAAFEARMIAGLALPAGAKSAIVRGAWPEGLSPDSAVVDWATGAVTANAALVEAAATADAVRAIKAAFAVQIAAVTNGQTQRLLTEVGSATASPEADEWLTMLNAWDDALCAVRDGAIAAATPAADVVWPAAPPGLAAFMAQY
jgi:hypothetical protein